MNAKGGMNDEECGKYVKNALVPLFPDSGDVPGKRVSSRLQVDSGPGHLNVELVASLWILGFYLYPGVPNTTAVTQDMDLTSARLNCNMSPSIQPFLIGLLVFGGIDPISHETLPKNAFQEGFSEEKCLVSWSKVGAAPVTCKCLESKKVRCELGDADDDMNNVAKLIEEANFLSCHFLSTNGYNGLALRVIN